MIRGWEQIKIKGLGKVVTGNTPPRKEPELYGKHTLFIKPTDINIGARYCLDPEECYSELGYKKYKNSLIPKGATCVVTIGSIGQKIIQAHTSIFINQAMNAVIPYDEYDELFVFYLLELNLPQLKLYDSGTASGRENVSKSSFSNIDVIVPKSKVIQQKIARILSAYDDLIENNLKRIKLLEEMAQLTYEEWFVRLKFPGHEQTVIDPETGLPEGWMEEKIKNTEIKLIDGDRGSNYPKQNDFHDKEYCLFLNTGNVTLNGFNFNNCKFITKEKDSILRKGKIEYCDIILTTRGTIGNVAFYKKGIPFENIRINSGMLIVRSKKEVLPNYLYQTFISKSLKHQMHVFSYGAAQPQLPVGTLNNIKILIPKVQIQQEFSRIIETNIKTTNILRCQNQHLKEARDILLPRLMTGMINVEALELPETVANKTIPTASENNREASINDL